MKETLIELINKEIQSLQSQIEEYCQELDNEQSADDCAGRIEGLRLAIDIINGFE